MTGARGARAVRQRAPVWLFGAAASFILYFGLLLVSDALRPEPTGMAVRFDAGGALVADVVPGSRAAWSGLQPGDRITSYAERAVHTRLDWLATNANLVPGAPVGLEVDRHGARLPIQLAPAANPAFPLRRDTVALGIALAGQLFTLVLACLVAFRGPHDRFARLGAWLLASLAVFTVVPPFGFARHWRLLPLPLPWCLWLPFLSAGASGPLFFAFCCEFPRRVLRPRAVLALCLPAALAVSWHAWFGYVMVQREGRVSAGADWSGGLVAMNVVYVVGALGLLASQYRRLDQPGEQRRLRVLLAGAAVGCTAGLGVFAQFWILPTPQLTHSIFGSPVTLVGVPLLLAIPVSIAYTILRQRLFDVSLIVRQGVRYALARRLLLSLVPLLLVAVVVDLEAHRDRTLADVVRARSWRYVAVGALVAAAAWHRKRWLDALDRRFFRSRQRSEQILRGIADELRQASEPRRATDVVVQRVHQALQPAFVAALGGSPGDAEYEVLASVPPSLPGLRLGRDSRLSAIAMAIGRPLDLSPDHDAWIAAHLPEQEARQVFASQLELLVPVMLTPEHPVMLALGPKRSEEPYSGDDVALLEAIAGNLALLLERVPLTVASGAYLAECPVCSQCYDTNLARCPADHAILMVLDLPPVLGGRYRVTARLGAGGMGTVYGAQDESLGRSVAVKVLADHLVDSADAARRFKQEAQTAAGFDHPNVVTVYDFGVTADNRAFLVMERLEGRTLREEIRAHGPLEAVRALAVVRDLCDVLEAAHARGLVHRDLKPDNVFLARAGEASTTKVLDFGIAKVLSGIAGPGGRASTSRGLLVGSLPYMSPEQLRGEPVHPSWDLWALAVTAHEMLTGARPFDGPFGPGQRYETPPGCKTSLPLSTAELFRRALSEHGAERPRTAAEFRASFAAAIQPA